MISKKGLSRVQWASYILDQRPGKI